MEEQKSSAKTIRESTKQVVDKLLNLFGLKKDVGELTEKSNSKEIITGIHKLLVETEAQRKSDFKTEMSAVKDEEKETEKRHREILKALTVRRKPVKRVKKEEVKKKPTEKTGERKATPVEGGKTTPPAPRATPAPTPPTTSVIPKIVVGAASGLGISAAIAKGESAAGSYNAANMGTKNNKIIAVREPIKLEEMTIGEIQRRQSIKWGAPNESEKLFAVGKYQMIPETLNDAVKTLKNINPTDKFDSKMQERMFNEYLLGIKRPAIARYLNSPSDDPNLLHSAVKQLSLEWASIADPDIPGGKTSHYGSGNKASLSVDQAATLLRNDREKIQQKIKSVETPKIDITKPSVENKDLKKQIDDNGAVTNKTVNNVGVSESRQEQTSPKVVDDRSPLERVTKG